MTPKPPNPQNVSVIFAPGDEVYYRVRQNPNHQYKGVIHSGPRAGAVKGDSLRDRYDIRSQEPRAKQDLITVEARFLQRRGQPNFGVEEIAVNAECWYPGPTGRKILCRVLGDAGCDAAGFSRVSVRKTKDGKVVKILRRRLRVIG